MASIGGSRGCRPGLVSALVVVGVLAGSVAASEPAQNGLTYASRASGPAGAGADDRARRPSVSQDGRFVAFDSDARTLSDDDADGPRDVFVRDLETESTVLVSRASGATGPGGDRGSAGASISNDGRYVAFASSANNLSGEDRDGIRDIFVRDLATATTTLVSRADGVSGAAGERDSAGASISGDGRYVAFSSRADGLSSGDTAGSMDVFVRDLQAGTTTFVSRESGLSGAGGDESSYQPTLSADGGHVAFTSSAKNLSTVDMRRFDGVFVRDIRLGTTTYVSRASGAAGAAADSGSERPSISGDGRYVAFESFAANLTGDNLDRFTDVFVRDLSTDRTIHVSRTSGRTGQAADGSSGDASISGDGRYVAFESDADNLSRRDLNQAGGLFVRDLQGRTTTYASRAGGERWTPSYGDRPSISTQGRFLGFESGDPDLTDADDDSVQFLEDVFVRDLSVAARTIKPVLETRILTARQRGRRVRVRVSVLLRDTRGNPCRGKVTIGVEVGGSRRRRTRALGGQCVRPFAFELRVGELKPSVRVRARRLSARATARFAGYGALRADNAPARRRRVTRR